MNASDPVSQDHWNILLLDRYPLRRAGLCSFIQQSALSQGQACTVQEADPEQMDQVPQNVSAILVDLGSIHAMQPDAQQLLASLRRQAPPGCPIAVISDHSTAAEVRACFTAGVQGFIATHMEPRRAIHALAFVIGGGMFFPPEAMLEQAAADPEPILVDTEASSPMDESAFTQRQREVLHYLRRGYSNKLIGRELHMCESTVKVHVRQIMRKLGVSNRTQAALQILSGSDGTELAADITALASPPADLVAVLNEGALPLRA